MISLQGVATVPETGRVSGVLRTPAGAPAARVRVSAMAVSGSPADAAALISLSETDETGRFVLENIPPGRYYIVAGRVDLPTVYPGTQEISRGTVLTVAAGATIPDIDFAIAESSNRPSTPELSMPRITQVTLPVSVTVEDGGKVPVSADGRPATIHLTPVAGGNALEAPLSSTGIAIPVRQGAIEEYRVRVENLPEGYVVKSMTFGLTDLTTGTLKTARAVLIPGNAAARIVTYTGQGELQRILDGITEGLRPPSSLSIVLTPAR